MFFKEVKGYELIQKVNELLDTRVEHQRIKEFGSHSKIRTIIRDEMIELSQYLKRMNKSSTPKFISKI